MFPGLTTRMTQTKTTHNGIAVGRKFPHHRVGEQEVLVAGLKEENDCIDASTFKFLRLKMNNELFYSKHYQRA